MTRITRITTILLAGASLPLLSACGADGVASPGAGGTIIINPTPTPSPTPTPTPTPTTGVTPAANCPTIAGNAQLTNRGTIGDGTNTWRDCQFPARFTDTTTIPKTPGVIYSLGGRVDVGTDQGAASTGNNVTLTIEPGVVVYGEGADFLAVNRGNRISAVGTATQPIIFTGRQNIIGTATDDTSQLWGGIVLLGRAPITDCLASGATPGTVACERDTEGTSNALYGGAQADDNSGTLRYVQVRYSGFILSGGSELQGVTPSGAGSATTIDHVQVHNSSDDGFEVFGGRVNMKNLVLTGIEDDGLDTDVGYKGSIQYVIAIQRSNIGNGMIEADSDNSNFQQTPRQNTKLANFTFIHHTANPDTGAAILIRGGADYTLINGVVVADQVPCLAIRNSDTLQAADPTKDEAGAPVIHSVLMKCGASGAFASRTDATYGNITAAQVQAVFEAGTNNNANYTPTLTNVFINGANESAPAVTAFGDEKTISAFFDNVDYIGAVRDANDTWYAGWTCNSSFANFGSTSGSCTAIPTT